MSANAALITATELDVKPEQVEAAAAAWQKHNDASGFEGRILYRGLETNSVLELAPLEGFDRMEELRADWWKLWEAVGPNGEGDFRRQILQFVEAPKPAAGALPDTRYVQMRHVEVVPRVYRAYRAWREETIFDVVRTSDEVESFQAFHSLASTEPGVMFVSGFNADPAKYMEAFTSPRYQQIVREAGDTYITGGDHGLYTRIYERITAA
jgi:hypothetical protein